MEKYNCMENGHVYGIWKDANDGNAERVCEQCSFICKVPIDEDIKGELEKQEYAIKLWQAFGKIQNDDQHLIDYLQIILEDGIPYLDRPIKDNVVTRMDEIKNSGYLTEENKVFFNYLMQIIHEKKNNGKLYWEIMDEFQNYNSKVLVSPLYEENTQPEIKGHYH